VVSFYINNYKELQQII